MSCRCLIGGATCGPCRAIAASFKSQTDLHRRVTILEQEVFESKKIAALLREEREALTVSIRIEMVQRRRAEIAEAEVARLRAVLGAEET